MKIRTIDHGRDVIAKINQMFPPFYLFGLVPRAKGNVMHRTRGNTPHPGVRQTKEVNDSAVRRVVLRTKAKAIARFSNQTIAETVGE